MELCFGIIFSCSRGKCIASRVNLGFGVEIVPELQKRYEIVAQAVETRALQTVQSILTNFMWVNEYFPPYLLIPPELSSHVLECTGLLVQAYQLLINHHQWAQQPETIHYIAKNSSILKKLIAMVWYTTIQ